MRQLAAVFCGIVLLASLARAQTTLAPAVRNFVKVDAPLVALTHVRVIDGTGAAPREDQTVLIEHGQIRAIASASSSLPAGAQVVDLIGHTVFPGLVGMHDHLFYPSGRDEGLYLTNELAFSAPRLYLACGVTSLRTTGSLEPQTDINLKRMIDDGKIVGPKLHLTGPYLEGKGTFTPNLGELRDADDARETVEFWLKAGITSFKAYMNITRAELSAAIEAAHRRGVKVTGHLCSIGFREAAELGIDDLEHGLLVDTEFVPGKRPDVCPPQAEADAAMAQLDVKGEPVQAMIRELVKRHVAVTSTLPVFETFAPNRPPLRREVLDALLPEARADYLTVCAQVAAGPHAAARAAELAKEMEFERAFAQAGGLLLAGCDPTGYGGVLPGFGDQREVELLVEAGFTPLEALRVASANGAQFLGESERVGTLEPGKQADLVVVRGDPSKNIADVEKVEMAFKDGVGYDSARLIDSVRGTVGLH